MADGFIGEIRLFGFGFAPPNWKLCDGDLLPVQEFTALFSIIGTNYGGNGTTNFGVPDFRGRVPVGLKEGLHLGQGLGVSENMLHTVPRHRHRIYACNEGGTEDSPLGHRLAATIDEDGEASNLFHSEHDTELHPGTIASAGSGPHPFDNRQPYETAAYYICCDGVYPQRS